METNNNKFTKALVAAFVVFGSILSFSVKFVADDAVLAVDRPTFIRVTPNNNASVLVGDSIYFINGNGVTTKVLDLEEEGYSIRGDYDFFSNGDLLFYSNNEEGSALENLSQFFRIKETKKDMATGADGLYRCSYWMDECRLFTNELPALHKTFGLFIDRESDTVYLSDTTRFILYKLDKEGNLLAQSEDGLYFPNQIHLHDNKLYVADTNHHSIKVVSSETERFGETVENHEVAIDGRYSWPTEIIKTPENWWLGIADNAMKNGGIQRYDTNWEKVGVTLLKGIDAASRSLALFGNEIWVTDWENIKIHRFDLSGKRLGDFENNEINHVFSESNKLVKQYETTSFKGLLAFFLVFSCGIMAAFLLEKEETLNLFNTVKDYSDIDYDTSELKSPPGNGVYWVEHTMNKYRKISTVVFALALIYLMWLMARVLSSESETGMTMSFLMMSLIPLFMTFFWFWSRVTKTKIGVLDEYLLADDGQGNVGKGKGVAIKYSRSIMVVDNVVILLGQPYRPFFPKDELTKWVIPRMRLGESVSHFYILKILWRQKHPSIVTFIIAFVYIALMIVFTSFYKSFI